MKRLGTEGGQAGQTLTFALWHVKFSMCKKLLVLVLSPIFFNVLYADLGTSADSLKIEIEKNPDNYSLHLQLGSCYYSLEEYSDALKEFHQVLQINPENLQAKIKIAITYYNMDSLNVAREKFETLLRDYSEKKQIYLWLAAVYYYLGMYDEMLQLYDQYEMLAKKSFFKNYTNRDYYETYTQRSRAYSMLMRYEKAIDQLRKAIDWYWSFYSAEINLAVLYKKLGDEKKAQKWCNRSINDYCTYCEYTEERTLEQHEILDFKGYCYWVLGDFENSLLMIDSIILLEKSEPRDVFNRGIIRIATGDTSGLDDLQSIGEEDTIGKFQAIYNAVMSIKVDSLSSAEAYLRQDIAELRKSNIAQGLLAWVLEKDERMTEAKKCWHKCYMRFPLGVDIESMRNFVGKFVKTIKEQE